MTRLEPRVALFAFPVLALLAGAAPAKAADRVTYYDDVAPILRANCQSCHQPVGRNMGALVAPMPLMTYEETRPYARAIARKVQSREMPPWFAEAPRGVFSNERVLTDKEIQTLVAWVEAGAPAGDKSHATPAPATTEAATGGWSLGKPDLVVKMPKPFLVPDDAEDLQVTFYTKIAEDLLPQDVYVRGWEFRTGTYGPHRNTIHHMCGGVESPEFDPNTAEVQNEDALSLGCIAGGAEPAELPEGFGRLLKKGSTIAMGMHYYKEAGAGTGYMNEAEIGFYFAKGPVKHVVSSTAIGNLSLEIPPGAENHRVGGVTTLKNDTLIIALWPHAHLRATAARYVAVYPDGHRELLLDVPRYDQGWQVTYKYREPKLLPKGTRIEVAMTYDNTTARAAKKQFDATRRVFYGPRTQDEMMLGFFEFAPAQPASTETQQQQQ